MRIDKAKNIAKVAISDIKVNPNNPRLYECLNCKEIFHSSKWCASRTPKYCSKKCYSISLIIDKHKNCIWCWKDFETKVTWLQFLPLVESQRVCRHKYWNCLQALIDSHLLLYISYETHSYTYAWNNTYKIHIYLLPLCYLYALAY